MGIFKLHTFIRKQCIANIKKQKISELSGHMLAIDVSQFLYRFKKTDRLVLDMFSFCSIFRKYNIHLLFIFDGTPPEEKTITLAHRKEKRLESLKEVEELKRQVEEGSMGNTEEIQNKIKLLKDNAMSIDYNDIQNVKTLLKKYGMNYVTANGEADQMCAYLCKKGIVYGVISDDTDMFALGCKRVIRYVSLLNETLHLYDIYGIYKTLDLTESQFRWLCAISLNDYNTDKNVYKTFEDNYRSNVHRTNQERHNEIMYLFDVEEQIKKDSDDKYIVPMITNLHYNKMNLLDYLKQYSIFEVCV